MLGVDGDCQDCVGARGVLVHVVGGDGTVLQSWGDGRNECMKGRGNIQKLGFKDILRLGAVLKKLSEWTLFYAMGATIIENTYGILYYTYVYKNVV